MPRPLIIVESPTKARTIEKFLGRRYTVAASMGHVRDLPKSQLGVDVDKGFEPKYITIRGKGEILKDLRKATSKAAKVLLATDPDREGEAISWHLAYALGVDDRSACRVEFHEITKDAVNAALKHPRTIDQHLVDSQQARRVLDRLVGYNLSPLLWKKVRPGLSAGRVQSAALRMVVDREEAIVGFVPKEYWSITAHLATPGRGEFQARFYGEQNEKAELNTSLDVERIIAGLEGAEFTVTSVKKRERKRSPAPPFVTSTLQQEASRKLNFGVRRTMRIAQQLYEGIDIGPGGQVGLITYIRTDSTRISDLARDEARKFITEKYGKEYVETEIREEERKPGQQGAHEAIRPTSVFREPDSVREYVTPDQLKLYRLVWERHVASNMAPALYEGVTVEVAAGRYSFRASGSTLKFAGFIMIYVESRDEETKEEIELTLPEMESGALLALQRLEPKQHFTQPSPGFTEAMLVKSLEEKGIGRPSTYAPIVETLLARGYVTKVERRIIPTELGKVVTLILREYFPNVVSVEFTAQMEQRLDDVESGRLEWRDVLDEFYSSFAEMLHAAEERIGGFEIQDDPTDVPCEKCGRMMVKKHGRYGEFLACPGFPECRNTKPIVQQLDVACPQCDGALVVRKTKKGRTFYGCSNYPACTFVTWDKPVARACPDCSAFLVEKKNRGKIVLKCSRKDCEYVEELEPRGETEE